MEVVSPATLWKDFDRRNQPLDVSVVSMQERDGYRIKSLYYSALKVQGGVVRVYAKLYVPLSQQRPPVILYLNDIDKDIEQPSTLMQAMPDYAFLKLDYAGAHAERTRFTLYPQTLQQLNYFSNPRLLSEMPQQIKTSCWYIWAVAAARAITLLEEMEEIDSSRIGLVGIGEGGSTAFKIASLPDTVRAAMTIYSFDYYDDEDEKSIDFTGYKASLNAESYAPYITVPLLEQITSNERNGSIDFMNDVFEAVKHEACRLSIVERSNRGIAAKQRKNCLYWFDYYLKGEGSIPKMPEISAQGSENRLYYEIKTDDSMPIASVELFVAQAMQNGAYRNWSGKKIEKISENEYISVVPIYDTEQPVYAFVNVKYAKNICLSSTVLTRVPSQMDIHADEIKQSRLIYESEMGMDDWLVLDDNKLDDDIKLVVEAGPFGITGVGSITGSLSTFKIGDFAYRNFSDGVLQLLLYSSVNQEITFAVTVNHNAEKAKEFVEYTCTRRISPSDNWMNLSLTATDFKSSAGTLGSFENIATFELRSEYAKVLISSMLWV